MPKERRSFTPEFKQQMVDLYEKGKSKMAIIDEYELTASALDRWINKLKHQVLSKKKIIALLKRMN